MEKLTSIKEDLEWGKDILTKEKNISKADKTESAGSSGESAGGINRG